MRFLAEYQKYGESFRIGLADGLDEAIRKAARIEFDEDVRIRMIEIMPEEDYRKYVDDAREELEDEHAEWLAHRHEPNPDEWIKHVKYSDPMYPSRLGFVLQAQAVVGA